MTSFTSPRPRVYGTLLVENIDQANAAVALLDGADAPEPFTRMEDAMERLSAGVDRIFPPAPSPGGPFMTTSEFYPTYHVPTSPNGYVQINTRPENWDYARYRDRINELLTKLTQIGVYGYVEVDVPGDSPERTMNLLTSHGVHSEAAPSLFED